MENHCLQCKICDGRACRDRIPGPGAKGRGDVAIRNYDRWQRIRINMDTLHENREISTACSFFGHTFRLPVFAGPAGDISRHYGEACTDQAFWSSLVQACGSAGICAFTGDGLKEELMVSACRLIGENGGRGIPTIKPWDKETVKGKMDLAQAAGALAVAMDVDAAGLPFLRGLEPPAGPKSEADLRALIASCRTPFIVKGIMTVRGAEKAIRAGASAIVVSNHGGRVLDQCPATAEVLEEIAFAVAGRVSVLVDGGIRSGVDIFKALALGADGVLITRPFLNAFFKGGERGMEELVSTYQQELEDTMQMTGAFRLADIRRDMVRTEP